MKIVTTILLLRLRIFSIYSSIHPSIHPLVLRKTSRTTLCEDQTIACLYQLDRCCQQMILAVDDISDSMFVFDALILLRSNKDHFENSKFLKLTAYYYKVDT